MRCRHCNKEFPYEQIAIDFQFFTNVNDIGEEERDAYALKLSKDYSHMRFFQNFLLTDLCYNCSKKLENILTDFANI